MAEVLTVLLAGGKGARLEPLTRDRAKPAVPFAGMYRIVDFALSNCINSRLFNILALTQYKSLSLEHHVAQGWGRFFHPEFGQWLTVSVGSAAVVRRAILDKGVRIRPGARVGVDPGEDRARGFVVSGGRVTCVAEDVVVGDREGAAGV